MRIVCFALGFEAGGFVPPGGWEVRVLGCAGEAAAPAFENLLSSCQLGICVSAGLAGGLNPRLRVGDVRLVSAPEDFLPPALLTRAGCATVRAPVTSRSEKLALHLASGSDVCDMETNWQLVMTQRKGWRFFSLRAVSDPADHELPISAEALCEMASGRPNVPRMLGELALHPGRLPAFARMVRSARVARVALHVALHRFLTSL